MIFFKSIVIDCFKGYLKKFFKKIFKQYKNKYFYAIFLSVNRVLATF